MTKVMRFFLYTGEPLRARSHKVRRYTKKASAKQMPICEVSMMARGGRELRPQGANFNRITLNAILDI